MICRRKRILEPHTTVIALHPSSLQLRGTCAWAFGCNCHHERSRTTRFRVHVVCSATANAPTTEEITLTCVTSAAKKHTTTARSSFSLCTGIVLTTAVTWIRKTA